MQKTNSEPSRRREWEDRPDSNATQVQRPPLHSSLLRSNDEEYRDYPSVWENLRKPPDRWMKKSNQVEFPLLAASSQPSSSVLPSTELPSLIHSEQIYATNVSNAPGDRSLQSQGSERDKARAAWTARFGDRQVQLSPADPVPFQGVRHLGRGGGGSVEETSLGGVAVAWKRIYTRARRLTPEEKNEVQILCQISKRRHRHIVELIGSYIHQSKTGIELGMLIWPVAHCDLGHLLKEIDYLGDSLKEPPNGNITSEDVGFVIETLYPLISDGVPPQERFDDRQYRYGLYKQALVYLRSKVGCIGQAVAYLHQSGIRHKDLKPAQVLLSGSGLWLTDFGWSKDISQMTNSVTAGGHEITLKYHAPERIAGKPCGKPEDIFALGCIFLEIGYRLLRQNPQTTGIELPWASYTSFSASLENIDTWIAPFIDQPYEFLQHFGYVIKQMLHSDPKSRPTICGVTEMLSMPYRKTGSPQVSNPFVSNCCVPARWTTLWDENGIPVSQRLHTIVDPIARKIVGKWVKQEKHLRRIVSYRTSKEDLQDGSIFDLYHLSEDEDMSDADSYDGKSSHDDRGELDSSLRGISQGTTLPQVITSTPDHVPPETSIDEILINVSSRDTPPVPVGWNQQYWPAGTVDHNSARLLNGSPYQPSLDTENSTEGLATYDCGMTIYRVQQPDGSVSVEAYYPPEYPVALRGRRLGTLEKDKALELLAKTESKSLKLVPVTREDGRRSVTPAPPSPNPGRRESVQSADGIPAALWGSQSQVGHTQPRSTRSSIDHQYLSPFDSGYGYAKQDLFPSSTTPTFLADLPDTFQLFSEKCELCGQSFTTKEDLGCHNELTHSLQWSTDIDTWSLQCRHCGKWFTRGESLDIHIGYMHSALDPPHGSTEGQPTLVSAKPPETERCSICGVVISCRHGKKNLAKHMREKHGGANNDYRWPCEEEGCPRVFRRRANRSDHYVRRHPHWAKASPSPRRREGEL